MTRFLPLSCLLLAVVAFAPGAGRSESRQKPATKESAAPDKEKEKQQELRSKEARLAFIRRAQVWAPTKVPAMDLRAGPQGPGAFQPDEAVTCDYVEKKSMPGHTPKFDCAVREADVVKVRYGATNGKVQGSVLATRLLWALGFGADRLYPVRVTCRGCSPDPWTKRERVPGEQVFDPAAIERKPPGHEMASENKGGWAWPELDLIDERLGGAPRAQVDALKLLAVFLQHTDSKEEQERLLCLPNGRTKDGGCDAPFMMMHDVGLTFGQANVFNRTSVGSVNFEQWTKTPIWKDTAACIGHLPRSMTGTLDNPKIGEPGRQFLADLLLQLSDRQLHDLFDVARVNRRSRRPDSSDPPATVDEWVASFKHKRDEIVNNRCK